MRLLFDIDMKDYDKDGTAFIRPSVRGIIIKNGLLAMIHSLKYDYFKFCGGGIENGEDMTQALIRETAEEAGLKVIPESIREYGYVHRIQKGKREDMFIQDNYYYICDTENDIDSQNLDDYEAEEKFTLEYVSAEKVIETNRNADHGDADRIMIERETRVMEMLIEEGILTG